MMSNKAFEDKATNKWADTLLEKHVWLRRIVDKLAAAGIITTAKMIKICSPMVSAFIVCIRTRSACTSLISC